MLVDRARTLVTDAQERAEATTPGAALRRFFDHGMSERAASLAFYALFSLIPILLIASALFRLVGDPQAVEDVRQAASDAGASTSLAGVLGDVLQTALESAPADASSVGLIGLATLLYGSSKVFSDAGRALDRIRGSERVTRPLTKRAADLAWTILLLGCALTMALLIFVTGDILKDLLHELGLGDLSENVWNLARWPLLACLALVIFAVVTWAGPTGARRPFRPLSVGAIVAAALWLAMSAGFAIYLATFARYNVTYGAFAAIIIAMVWIWASCVVFLYAAELDAVLDDRRG